MPKEDAIKEQQPKLSEQGPDEASDRTRRFAEIGRLCVEVKSRERDQQTLKECLAALAEWTKQMGDADKDPVVPAVLKPFIELSGLQEFARKVRAAQDMREIREKLDALAGRA
jgi:hypothetical protein